MEITLSDGTVIEVLQVSIDWKRKEGYTGACVSKIEPSDIEYKITSILEDELVE